MSEISVVMATYNGEKFLVEQLDSILSQTRMPDELVIVDDCSTDTTPTILKDYQCRYPSQVKIFENNERLGVNKNFEKAAHLSKGNLIFFSDQDDVWDNKKIQVMVENLGGFGLLYSDAAIVDEIGEIICNSELEYHNVPAIQGKPLLYFFEHNSISGHNVLVTRDILNIAIPFHPGFMYDRWLGAVSCLKDGISYLDRVLVKHRIHRSNAQNSPEIMKLKKTNKIKISKLEKFRKNTSLNLDLIKCFSEIGTTDETISALIQIVSKHLNCTGSVFFNRELYENLISKYYIESNGVLEKAWLKSMHRLSRGELYYRIFRF